MSRRSFVSPTSTRRRSSTLSNNTATVNGNASVIVSPGDPGYANSRSYLKKRQSANRSSKRQEIMGFLEESVDDDYSLDGSIASGVLPGIPLSLVSPRRKSSSSSSSLENFLNTLPGDANNNNTTRKSMSDSNSLSLEDASQASSFFPCAIEESEMESHSDDDDNSELVFRQKKRTSKLTDEERAKIKAEAKDIVNKSTKKKQIKAEKKEAKRKAKKEAKLKAEAEEKLRVQAEEKEAERIKEEEEARIKAETKEKERQEARIKAEQEEAARLQAQEEARIKAEQDAIRAKQRAEEEKRAEAADAERLRALRRSSALAEEARLQAEFETFLRAQDEAILLLLEEAASVEVLLLSEEEARFETVLASDDEEDSISNTAIEYYTESEDEVTVESEGSQEFHDAIVISDKEDSDYFYETDETEDSDESTVYYETDDGENSDFLEDIIEEGEEEEEEEDEEEGDIYMEVIAEEDEEDDTYMEVIAEEDGDSVEEHVMEVIEEEEQSYDGEDEDEFYDADDDFWYETDEEIEEDEEFIEMVGVETEDESSVEIEAFYVDEEGEEIVLEGYESAKEEFEEVEEIVPVKKDPLAQKFKDFLKRMTSSKEEDDVFANLMQVNDEESVDTEVIVFSESEDEFHDVDEILVGLNDTESVEYLGFSESVNEKFDEMLVRLNDTESVEYIGDDGMIEEEYYSDENDNDLVTIGTEISFDHYTSDEASSLGSADSSLERDAESLSEDDVESYLEDNEDLYYSDDMVADYEEDDRYKFLVPVIPVLQKWELQHHREQLKEIHREAKENGFVKETNGPEVAARTPRNIMMAILHAGALDFKLRKVPEEHKNKFQTFSDAAASLGRLTKLKEHVVQTESVGLVETKEETWKPSGEALVITRSASVRISNEAAAMGQIMRLREEYLTNWDEDDYEETKFDMEEKKAKFERNMDKYEREGDIDELRDERGHIVFRTSLLIHHHVRDSRVAREVKDWNFEALEKLDEQEELQNNLELPTTRPPKFGVKKATTSHDRHSFIEAIAQGVAESAWDRKYRLERPKAELRMKSKCYCTYCKNPNPFQTHAYKKLSMDYKVNGIPTPEVPKPQPAPERRTLDLTSPFVPQDSPPSTPVKRRRSIDIMRHRRAQARLSPNSVSSNNTKVSLDVAPLYESKRIVQRSARVDWTGAITPCPMD